jgi:hypothetical protein
MRNTDRRSVLKLVGSAVLLGGVGVAGTRLAGTREAEPASGTIEKLGRSPLFGPESEYTEAAVRADGRYGVVGSYAGTSGSFLVDLADLRNPRRVHQVPSEPGVRNADVAFDSRDGLYYRTQEPSGGHGGSGATIAGVEVIDYGHEAGSGSPKAPEVIAAIDAEPTHNLFSPISRNRFSTRSTGGSARTGRRASKPGTCATRPNPHGSAGSGRAGGVTTSWSIPTATSVTPRTSAAGSRATF